MTPEQQNKLDQTYNYFLTHVVEPDPYYTGNTPSDYTSGAIFQTYDYYERKLNMESANTLTLPKVYFANEPNCSSTIKLDITFQVKSSPSNVMFKTYINGTLFDTEIKEISTSDTDIHFTKTLYDVLLNQNQRGNNIYVEANLQTISGTRTINVSNQKVEITAPNVEVLNNICPFNAIFIDGKYYVTDSSENTAKVATIAMNDMYNMNNLTWIDTNIESNLMKIVFNSTTYQSDHVLDQIGYLNVSPNNTYATGMFGGDSVSFSNSTVSVDFRVSFDSSFYYLAQFSNLASSQNYYYNPSTNVLSYNSGITLNAQKIICANHAQNIYQTSGAPICFLTIDANGLMTYHINNSSNIAKYHITLDYCHDATLYIDNIITSGNYDAHIYYKRFDKMIYKKYHMQSNTLTLLSETEIGNYDKYFKMPNNDYFVVKNDQILYYKEQLNQ